jgi:hypothetical protein
MMDWADEIAEKVNREPVKTVGDREELIAAAISKVARENKAAGMREAADLIIFRANDGMTDFDFIRAMADKIEHGEPK